MSNSKLAAIRIDVAVDKRIERAEVLLRHAAHPLLVAEDVLNHERVHVDEAVVKEVKGKDRDLLV